jgi:hypothetical protein
MSAAPDLCVHVGETLVGNMIDSVQHNQLNAKNAF